MFLKDTIKMRYLSWRNNPQTTRFTSKNKHTLCFTEKKTTYNKFDEEKYNKLCFKKNKSTYNMLHEVKYQDKLIFTNKNEHRPISTNETGFAIKKEILQLLRREKSTCNTFFEE